MINDSLISSMKNSYAFITCIFIFYLHVEYKHFVKATLWFGCTLKRAKSPPIGCLGILSNVGIDYLLQPVAEIFSYRTTPANLFEQQYLRLKY